MHKHLILEPGHTAETKYNESIILLDIKNVRVDNETKIVLSYINIDKVPGELAVYHINNKNCPIVSTELLPDDIHSTSIEKLYDIRYSIFDDSVNIRKVLEV